MLFGRLKYKTNDVEELPCPARDSCAIVFEIASIAASPEGFLEMRGKGLGELR